MISLCFHWLLTYFVHSTVLLVAAALLDWRRRLTARGMSSTLWRIALFGGFVSATVQPGLEFLVDQFGHAGMAASAANLSAIQFSRMVVSPLHVDAIDFAPLAVPIWFGVFGVAMAYLLVRLLLLKRAIGRMPRISLPDLERSACRLARLARIPVPELRAGTRLHAPLVAPGGVVCIPAWMLEQYESSRLLAALAHEMGHLRRNDNRWRIHGRIASLLGWFQPLNRLAIRRLDEAAEFACDSWAASATGLRRELALSLEDCAVRVGHAQPDAALTTGMAARHFTLLARVQRLLEDPHVNTQNFKRAARWSSVALLGVAIAGSLIVISTFDDDVPPRWLASNGIYQSLLNSSEDRHATRSVVIKSPEHYVYIRVTENFSLAAPQSGAKAMGTAVVAETRGGTTRSVRFERDSSSRLHRIYKVDGKVRPIDLEGERWLEGLLPLAAL